MNRLEQPSQQQMTVSGYRLREQREKFEREEAAELEAKLAPAKIELANALAEHERVAAKFWSQPVAALARALQRNEPMAYEGATFTTTPTPQPEQGQDAFIEAYESIQRSGHVLNSVGRQRLSLMAAHLCLAQNVALTDVDNYIIMFNKLVIFRLDAIPAAFLAHVLAQELGGLGIEQANENVVPLHAHHAPDPAWRRAVVGSFDFDAAVQMHDAFAVLVIAKGFDRQRKQERFLFCKHSRDLAFGGAVNAGVGPAFFPAIEIGLGFFQTLEAQTLEWRFLRMADAGFDFALAIWVLDATRHGDRAVMREHVAIERIESGIVDVGDEHAFAQIVEHDDARGPA